MKKEYLVGGLAIVGAISLVVYLNSKSKPRLNSDGFFNAQGKSSLIKQEIPSSFIRKGGFPTGCARYEKFLTPNGNGYLKRKIILSNTAGMPDQISIETFPINEQEFINAFASNALCRIGN
jgi:hypothetical protein